jgi:uncharacterized membrane protein
VRREEATAHRMNAFSDAVFAVIVTIMVLELRAPVQPSYSALWPLWPTALSYGVSYLFIAIIWINHHHLMRLVGAPTLRLMWINFLHLFLVSILPFATAWVAGTHLASPPVVVYAGLFVCIDIAYNVFEREVLTHAEAAEVPERSRRLARRRSLGVLAGFAAAMLVAIVAPRLGFGLICAALILHLRPDLASGEPCRTSSRLAPQIEPLCVSGWAQRSRCGLPSNGRSRLATSGTSPRSCEEEERDGRERRSSRPVCNRDPRAQAKTRKEMGRRERPARVAARGAADGRAGAGQAHRAE